METTRPPLPNKRITSMPNTAGSQNPANRNHPESVRAKLRESLAHSLPLLSKYQNHPHGNDFPPPSFKLYPCFASTDVTQNSFKLDHTAHRDNTPLHEVMPDNAPTFKSDAQQYHFNYLLPEEDVPFAHNYFIKDELLQGNGLCWLSDLQLQAHHSEETHSAKRLKLLHQEAHPDGNSRSSPQDLATRIEAELFKLYGGVNKKYKEKGRSLLFNLKDRNNPELRERVISGEIAPERLCSMTAEELASKELSEWRIAKAEELAQMVVLPDSSTDVRRLVKKTHKGEFQVEFEQDDGVSMEIAMGSSSLSQIRQKTDEKTTIGNATIEASKHDTVNCEDLNGQSSLTTLPDDGTDLMQGLMGDELKDADLPPIVSLDEFMESLDSEPPFENLPIDSGMVNQKSDEKGNPDVHVKLESSDHGSVNVSDTGPGKLEKLEAEYTRMDHNLKPNHIDGEPVSATSSSLVQDLKLNHSPKESEKARIVDTSMQQHVWEGLLQLNVSSMVTVTGNFKSGERTSTIEWTSFLDVKGRVKLDAFEKFLQELPMSRSRTIMTVHFCWKEGSPQSGRVNLCEVIDSYVADERVGFAEPAPGVELYLCPPHGKISEILGKHLTKDHIETLNAINDGLIGIVVWRKAHLTSTISPNSSSHHRHNARKHHLLSVRRQQEQNSNTNISKGPPLPREPPPSNTEPPLDELIDDIPPGFGPSAAAAKDEEDLPEFDFARGSNSSASHLSAATNPSPNKPSAQTPVRPSRAVEQMRELIHKYGRGAMMTNRGSEVDDDDDIPEWQPQSLSQPLAPPQRQLAPSPHTPPSPMVGQLVQSFQQPGLSTQMLNQPQHFQPVQQFTNQYHNQQLEHTHPMPIQHMQPMNMMQGQQNLNNPWQHGTSWPLPPPPSPSPSPSPQLRGPSICSSVLIPNLGGQPLDGQDYGTPPGFAAVQNGGWM